MGRQFSLVDDLPPISLLAPAADAAGRTSPFRSVKAAAKSYVVVRINQGSATPVLLTVLQGQDVSGTGSKPVNAMPIWLNNNTATSDAFVVQTPGANFTTDATLAEKIVVFEVLPEAAMDLANAFRSLAVETGASNVANITVAELQLTVEYKGASPLSTYIN